MYKALIICNSTYPLDPAALPELTGPRSDGLAIWSALTDGQTGLFGKENVRPVFERNATEILTETQEFFNTAGADDILLFYFSGHGKRSVQELILCARDTVSTSLLATGVRSDTISKMIADSSANTVIIVLDCCHSGAFKGDELAAELGGSGRFVLAAAHATELAKDAEAKDRPSPFTATIAEGLTSADIDFNGDSVVDLDDLYGFAHSKLAKSGPEPIRNYDGAGDIPIAKRQEADGLLSEATADPFAQPILPLRSLFPGIKKNSARGLHASGWSGNDKLIIPVGRIYEPGKGWVEALCADFSGGAGNFIVVGGMMTGKTMALCTLACSMALTHKPNDVQIYGLQPNIGALASLAGMPHVGAVVRYSEREEVTRLVKWVSSVLVLRERRCASLGIKSPRAFRECQKSKNPVDKLGDIVLVIDSWHEFVTGFPELVSHCVKIAKTGLYYGMHLALSVDHWPDVEPELARCFNAPIELPLTDPRESKIDQNLAASLPFQQAGFGLFRGGRYVQMGFPALAVTDAMASEADALGDLVTQIGQAWTGYRAPAPQDNLLDEPFMRDVELSEILGDIESFGPAFEWAAPPRGRDRLKVPIGIDADGRAVALDLKEPALGGMGPHGLLVGAAGSGKSEFLRTLLLALALTHSPEVLNFALIDFKGGATFLGLDRLPHVSTVITYLERDLPLVDRARDVLHGELVHREDALREARGEPLLPFPALFIVVDEFSELLSAKPEFADLFLMIGRLGPLLGVHLLLASQRLERDMLDRLDSHLSYRIGLRTFSAADSRAVLGMTDAYELPPQPGNGYLKTRTGMVRFKAAHVSGWRDSDSGAPGAAPREPMFDTVIRKLRHLGPAARQIWLPPLDVPPTLDELLPPLASTPEFGRTVGDTKLRGRLRVVTGIVDRPFEQRRDQLWSDLSGSGGHVGVAGAPQSGKSTMLRTLICSLAVLHTPAEVQIYVLDFGGGTLAALAGLPHVGGVAARLQAERVRRTVAEVKGLLERREREFTERGIESIAAYRRLRAAGEIPGDGYGDVFLVVDSWLTLRQEYEQVEAEVTALAARGLGYGIHVVAATNKWSEFRPSIRDLFGTRFELRLGDPYESEVSRVAAASVPERSPGRGLTKDGMHFLTALPRIDGRPVTDDLNDGVSNLVRTVDAAWEGPRAPEVRLLPESLTVSQLDVPAQTRPLVPIGLDENTLSPVMLDFTTDPHFVVFGDPGCGKSNLLRVIAEAVVAKHTPDRARIVVIDFRRSLLDVADTEHRIGYAASLPAAAALIDDVNDALVKRLPPAGLTAAQLRTRSWWSGADLYLFMDDYDLVAGMTNPLQPLVDLIAQARDIGLHMVLARSAGGAGRAMFEPVIQRLREMGSPALIMSGNKDEGALFGVKPQILPAGRGFLSTRRTMPIEVQIALAEPPR